MSHHHHRRDREKYPLCRKAVASAGIAIATPFAFLVTWPFSLDAAFVLVLPCASLGLWLGWRAKNKIQRHHHALRGEDYATAGLILNSIFTVIGLFIFVIGLGRLFIKGM